MGLPSTGSVLVEDGRYQARFDGAAWSAVHPPAAGEFDAAVLRAWLARLNAATPRFLGTHLTCDLVARRVLAASSPQAVVVSARLDVAQPLPSGAVD